MNKFWTIFKREFLTRVKTKAFIIGTALTPFLIIFLSIGPR
jgi:ABC-type Na+ efflux pump permease subunit